MGCLTSLKPMASAPKDGREIVVKLPRHEVYIRVRWDGQRWVSGTVPMREGASGWMPLPTGEGSAARPVHGA